jgi:hypothetical protein
VRQNLQLLLLLLLLAASMSLLLLVHRLWGTRVAEATQACTMID